MWLASVNGTVTPVEEALIPVSDEGLLRGDGGFEVLRIYGGRPFALDDHLERLVVRVQTQALARVPQAVDVIAERERPPAVEADHLEDAVAAIETVVLERDRGLRGGGDRPVDGCELVHWHRSPEAIQAGLRTDPPVHRRVAQGTDPEVSYLVRSSIFRVMKHGR